MQAPYEFIFHSQTPINDVGMIWVFESAEFNGIFKTVIDKDGESATLWEYRGCLFSSLEAAVVSWKLQNGH